MVTHMEICWQESLFTELFSRVTTYSFIRGVIKRFKNNR